MSIPNVRGLAELNRAFEKISKQEATKAGQVANRAGAAVYRKAVIKAAPNSPVTTEGQKRTRKNKGGTKREEIHGKIVNNVYVRKTRSSVPTQVHNEVFIGGKAYHANFVMWGSIHNTADPFMLDALKSSEEPLIATMAKVLNKQLIKRGV